MLRIFDETVNSLTYARTIAPNASLGVKSDRRTGGFVADTLAGRCTAILNKKTRWIEVRDSDGKLLAECESWSHARRFLLSADIADL